MTSINQQICANPLIRQAEPSDLSACMDIRGKTRDNPLPREVLESIGVTEQSWTEQMNAGVIIGAVATCEGEVVGYCFGDTQSAEILVLAILEGYDGQGFGKQLLLEVMQQLTKAGHQKLWLAAAPDPAMRAYGFYRHMGWTSTGTYDANGDELMEYFPSH